MENDARLPGVEALPITIGMINEAEVEDAKSALRRATRVYNLASHQFTRAERAGRKLKPLQVAFQRAQEGMAMAGKAFEIARQDGETTRSTLPVQRYKDKFRRGDILDIDGVASVEIDARLKRKWSKSVYGRKRKVKADDE